MRYFTRDNPPKSGVALRLWRKFTDAAIVLPYDRGTKNAGVTPDSLQVIAPGRVQQQAGAAQYEIVCDHVIYWIHDARDTLSKPIVASAPYLGDRNCYI